MPKGRPLKIDIRAKIAAILQYVGHAYGYQIYKYYKKIFGKIGLRNLYYNLKKGVETGEFIITTVKREEGEYTWGRESQHIYYSLGPNSIIYKLSERQMWLLSQLPKKEINVDWKKEIENQIKQINKRIDEFNSIKASLLYEDKRRNEQKLIREIENLKDWAKQKIGKNQEIKIKLAELRAKLNPHTP